MHRYFSAFLALATCSATFLGCGGDRAAEPEAALASPSAASSLRGDCPPTAGNNIGVGAPCTKGGHECQATGAPYCSIEVEANAPYSFCTRPCRANTDCGEAARCMPNPRTPLFKGCVPEACLPPI